jgi:hypothetical protein
MRPAHLILTLALGACTDATDLSKATPPDAGGHGGADAPGSGGDAGPGRSDATGGREDARPPPEDRNRPPGEDTGPEPGDMAPVPADKPEPLPGDAAADVPSVPHDVPTPLQDGPASDGPDLPEDVGPPPPDASADAGPVPADARPGPVGPLHLAAGRFVWVEGGRGFEPSVSQNARYRLTGRLRRPARGAP